MPRSRPWSKKDLTPLQVHKPPAPVYPSVLLTSRQLRADVQDGAFQDQDVQRCEFRWNACFDRERWSHDHADNFAAGDMAPPTWIQLRVYSVLGGSLHASNDAWIYRDGSAERVPLR